MDEGKVAKEKLRRSMFDIHNHSVYNTIDFLKSNYSCISVSIYIISSDVSVLTAEDSGE